MAGDFHHRFALGIAPRLDGADAAAVPVLLCGSEDGGHRDQRQGLDLGAWLAPGPALGLVALQVGKVGVRVHLAIRPGIRCGDAAGQVHRVEDHQPAEGDHQVKRQHQDARDVVRIEPRPLAALAGAEGEEVLEDAPVRDHPGEQGHEHEQRGHAHHPAAFQRPAALLRGAQLEVKAVEEVAAHGLADVHWLARLRVHAQGFKAAIATAAPQHIHCRVALVGQVHDPLGYVGHLAVQRSQGFFSGVCLGACCGGGQAVQLGVRPQVQLVSEERQRAREEDGKQQPAQHQPRPGVQPRHGLAKAFAVVGGLGWGLGPCRCGQGALSGWRRAHAAAPSQRGAMAMAPITAAGASRPSQAPQLVRA